MFGRVVDSLEDAFHAMDSSGRGSLEESDLARALHRLDIEMTNTQLKELLHHLDANGDGVVDAGEFLDAMRRHEESMNPTPAKGSLLMMNERESAYQNNHHGGSPIRSLRSSRSSAEGVSPSQHTTQHRELGGGGGGSLLSPSRSRRASYSPSVTNQQALSSSGSKPQWKR